MTLELPRHDYVSPGFKLVRPDEAFPNMIVGDTQVPQWPWLRRWVQHNWYTDQRNPYAGFADRDEASILYNAALSVRGKPCLEIGCWRGWSAVHLALGSGTLDVIDPILADPEFAESIYSSCAKAGVLDCITFHTGFSPAAVDELAAPTGRKWSLIFVDGEHEGDAPRQDAEAAMRHAADTAMVLFHDLASPFVAAGLHALRDAGWRTMIYQTMQIVGVAWRGDIEPPDHIPDPNVFWTLPAHLAGYHVSNWKRPFKSSFVGWWPDMTLSDQRAAAMMRAQAAEDTTTALLLGRINNEAIIAELNARLAAGEAAREADIADYEARLAAQTAEGAAREARLADSLASATAYNQALASQIAEEARQAAALRDQIEALAEARSKAVFERDQTVTTVAGWAADDAALDSFVLWMAQRRVLLGLIRRNASDRVAAVKMRVIAIGLGHIVTDGLILRLLRRRLLIGLLRRPASAAQLFVSRVLNDHVARIRGAMLRPTGQLIGKLQPSSARLPVRPAAAGIVLVDYLGCVGWDAKVAALHGFGADLLRDCLTDMKHPAEAELAWVKRAVKGLNLPRNPAELRDCTTRIADSGLFDAAFYRRQAGLSNRRIDPASHYMLVGDVLGIAPSERFNPGYYGARYPDIDAAGLNRLLHYVTAGQLEGRHPLPHATSVAATKPIDARRENVLIVVHEASRTGAPILGWNIVRHLADRYNVFTAILGPGPLVEAFAAESVAVCGPFPNERRHEVEFRFVLDGFLDGVSFKYAIVNSCESRYAVETCAVRQIPTVMLVHEFANLYPEAALAASFSLANELVFPAQIVADSALDVHPRLSQRRIVIQPQGLCVIPGKPPAAAGETPAALATFADDHFIVVGAGTVEFRKGVDFFIATAMAVSRDPAGAKVRFLWVGRGYKPEDDLGYSMYLQEQLKRSAVRDSVTFLSEVSDMDPVYQIADAFLLTSRLDPMPNVSIDAAHLGIPIVCFRNASGTADVLLRDPETARGVVDYLNPVAAADAILALARDPEAWKRRAEATRLLAHSVFDMSAYVDGLDALGRQAASAVDRMRRDGEILAGTDDFDQDLFLGPNPIFESRARSIGRALARGIPLGDEPVRRIAVGFNPAVWRGHHGANDPVDPLAAFISAGRPAGAWITPMLRPNTALASADSAVKALLHVHCTDTERAPDLLRRLRGNKHRFDLLVTTDSPVKAATLKAALRAFDLGRIQVHVTDAESGGMVEWLSAELRRDAWSAHDVIGHIHDGESDIAANDFQWTELLGGRQPMIDGILNAFAAQPNLGLVFPCDPLLPDAKAIADFPSGGMFWARRATLEQLVNDSDFTPEALPQACIAAGFTQAMTHVAGVFR